MKLHSTKDSAAADTVREKVSQLLKERAEIYGRLNANTQSLNDAVAAGRLFGAEIKVPTEFLRDTRAPNIPTSPTQNIQPGLFEAGGDVTIREAVADQLKMAGEKGIKAAALRRIIENMVGRQLHYKTIGMTLYRLSERGLARRDGFVWYFVPQAAETKTPAS